MIHLKYFSLGIPLIFLTLFISCSKPSNDDIIMAVKASLQQKVPVSLAKHLTGGQNATVEEIRVIEIGKLQERGSKDYWPVRIYAKGSCTKMFGGREPFEGEVEYIITKDDYGVLKANPKGF